MLRKNWPVWGKTEKQNKKIKKNADRVCKLGQLLAVLEKQKKKKKNFENETDN